MKLKDIYIRDPYILLCEDTYYMYGKEYLEQQSFVVYTSNDLVEWSEPKRVFVPDESFWGDRDFWAPEVHYYKNKYYMFASFKSDTRRRGCHILVSDFPDGNFVPISDTTITPEEWESLDATLYIDLNEKPHVVFCHEWQQTGDGTICEMLLTDDLTKTVGEPKVLWKASDSKATVNVFPFKKSMVTDGPFMYRLKNGSLICTWSTFSKTGYSVLIARSDNGDIDGNWSVDMNPIIEIDGGHGMIFRSKNDEVMYVMHSPNVAGEERAILFRVIEKNNTIALEKYYA